MIHILFSFTSKVRGYFRLVSRKLQHHLNKPVITIPVASAERADNFVRIPVINSSLDKY